MSWLDRRMKTWTAILLLLFGTTVVFGGVYFGTMQGGNGEQESMIVETAESVSNLVAESMASVFGGEIELKDPPPAPEIERMKSEGCVVDGLLNGYDNQKQSIKMINRSECYYLHRAIETWLEAPDFDDIARDMDKIEKEEVVYGMFIAEAIDTKSKMKFPEERRRFDFSKMCQDGTKNKWGEHTCVPSLKRSEYRKYVKHITERAMDLGVQSFMFGQIYHQDVVSESRVDDVISDMRDYASFRNMEIVIGAQTNDIDDEKYLRQFDFIEGGVGINSEGWVENGPCYSRWDNWCWALLWHDKFKSKANNVFVHLDWSGIVGDDMSVFARMSKSKRAETVSRLHKYFEGQDVGFLVPMLAVLPKENGGCHGDSRKFYSASKKYSCDDESAFNKVLK